MAKTYRTEDSTKIPEDAENIKMDTDGTITFMSETGLVEQDDESDDDEPCCQQCAAEDSATPDELAPRRSTPEGWN